MSAVCHPPQALAIASAQPRPGGDPIARAAGGLGAAAGVEPRAIAAAHAARRREWSVALTRGHLLLVLLRRSPLVLEFLLLLSLPLLHLLHLLLLLLYLLLLLLAENSGLCVISADAAFAAAALPSLFPCCSCCSSLACSFFEINRVDKRKFKSI